MNTLNRIHPRALVTASATMFAVLAVVLLYWRGVTKGSLPPQHSRWFKRAQKGEPGVATNPPTAKAVAVAAALAPNPATSASVPNAKPPAPSNQLALSSAAPKAVVVDAASAGPPTNALPRPPQTPAVTDLAAAASTHATPGVSTTVANITLDDKRVARYWLENTNQRPAIRVHYDAVDILRLSTELRRGLFVAGNGSTNRSEVFLQFASAKVPQFSPFTKSVANTSQITPSP